MERISYRDLTVGFLVLTAFVLSVSIGYLSHRIDRIEVKTEYIGKNIVK